MCSLLFPCDSTFSEHMAAHGGLTGCTSVLNRLQNWVSNKKYLLVTNESWWTHPSLPQSQRSNIKTNNSHTDTESSPLEASDSSCWKTPSSHTVLLSEMEEEAVSINTCYFLKVEFWHSYPVHAVTGQLRSYRNFSLKQLFAHFSFVSVKQQYILGKCLKVSTYLNNWSTFLASCLKNLVGNNAFVF